VPLRDILNPDQLRFVQGQRVGRLATADASGRPHVVPVCYAYDGARFYIALDEKPKRVADTQLRRVRNIVERPEASLLVDRYDDDWTRLGFVLIRAHATLLPPSDPAHTAAVALLRARYAPYEGMALEDRPLIALAPTSVSAWGTATRTAADEMAAGPPGRGHDFLPLAQGRRSVRVYQPRPVPRVLVEQVLEAARWAPSPHGRQPWRFVVLTRDEPKARLSDAMAAEWQRNLEMDRESPEVVAIRLEKSRLRIRHAPVAILPCLYLADLDRYPDHSRRLAEETMAIQSLGAAVQNMLLAAYSLGLDSGWMCAPLFCPGVVREALGLDSTLVPHALITLGYAARDPVRRPRRPLDELIARWD
jgi:coenzyme F420-0:L-glutamate ligase/coenzyme F420-1:gamma-L-glutamate ligase